MGQIPLSLSKTKGRRPKSPLIGRCWGVSVCGFRVAGHEFSVAGCEWRSRRNRVQKSGDCKVGVRFDLAPPRTTRRKRVSGIRPAGNPSRAFFISSLYPYAATGFGDSAPRAPAAPAQDAPFLAAPPTGPEAPFSVSVSARLRPTPEASFARRSFANIIDGRCFQRFGGL